MDDEKNKIEQENLPKNSEPQKDNKGSYMGVGMAIGTALGMLWGPMLFDSHAVGISIGMCLGMGIGSLIKKKK